MTRQSTTSRRGFLGFLGAAMASATLDPERLLWVPGAKVISIPKPKRKHDWDGLLYCGGQSIFEYRDQSGALRGYCHYRLLANGKPQIEMIETIKYILPDAAKLPSWATNGAPLRRAA